MLFKRLIELDGLSFPQTAQPASVTCCGCIFEHACWSITLVRCISRGVGGNSIVELFIINWSILPVLMHPFSGSYRHIHLFNENRFVNHTAVVHMII